MIIKSIEIEKFRAFEDVSFCLGRRITAIAGRNATQKTTVLGMIGQPFTISKGHPMYGCKTIDGYNFRSQLKKNLKYHQSMIKSDSIGGSYICMEGYTKILIILWRVLHEDSVIKNLH